MSERDSRRTPERERPAPPPPGGAGSDPAAERDVDAMVARLEHLYLALTGHPPPPEAAGTPIPAERDPSEHVSEQLDRLLGLLQGTGAAPVARPWHPPLSVWESDDEVVARVDLPGVRADQVEVLAFGTALRVRGVREPAPAGGHRLRHGENPVGPFERALQLGGLAPLGDPTARLADGVLEIRIPKIGPAETAPRAVPVTG